jgi:aspartyl-tRNA(Asn)/glutamyl-tRNA(Gln) amidotransferase subunit B
VERIKKQLPELPQARKSRFVNTYKLPPYDAGVLTADKNIADYFEKCLSFYQAPKNISNWVMTEVLREIKERKITIGEFSIPPEHLATLVKMFDQKQLTSTAAKDVFQEMLSTGEPPEKIVKRKGLTRLTDETEIEKIAHKVIQANPKVVADYQGGKKNAISVLIGGVMKETRGRADPRKVREILSRLLREE